MLKYALPIAAPDMVGDREEVQRKSFDVAALTAWRVPSLKEVSGHLWHFAGKSKDGQVLVVFQGAARSPVSFISGVVFSFLFEELVKTAPVALGFSLSARPSQSALAFAIVQGLGAAVDTELKTK
ncbi:hypothetical protein AK812_SmicGene16895 [Symbiodinium microadriaticum]|uniref:Uncharacterized protein n=1 Tax=Symbiodinium microadriaticum TaxID=2951 RepID=A0A1Q9DZ63_SYMMI|nr:hypothetical protein AK812_SmicGene16895 [Symbiodinium microadriaticum]